MRITELTLLALVDVLGAVDALVAAGAGAGVGAVGGARVADSVRVARVGRARVIQVTQQPCQQEVTHSVYIETINIAFTLYMP